MADERVAAQFVARATLAAALIQAGVVDLKTTHFADPTGAPTAPAVVKLKEVVNALMEGVVYAQ